MSILLANRFNLQQKVGEGTFAEVWRAIDMGANAKEAEVALKIFRPSAQGNPNLPWEPVFREIKAGLQISHHPNVLRVWAMTNVLFFKEQETPCLVMEYVNGTNLALWLSGQDPPGPEYIKPRLIVMDGLLHAIAHTHLSGVVHNDISFGNVLIRGSEPPQALLTDFGYSQTEEPNPNTILVENDYAEIQPINPPPYSHHSSLAQGAWRDIYAFGTLCYLALTGRHPLSDDWQNMRTGQWTGVASPHSILPRRVITELSPWMQQEPRLIALSNLLLHCVSVYPCVSKGIATEVEAKWNIIMSELI
jgi:serine/threonine-protein kinase